MKSEISSYLKSKYIIKVKLVSLYSLLTDFNRDFLELTEEGDKIEFRGNDMKRIRELTKWMRNPDVFEKEFNLSLNKKNIEIIIEAKYRLVEALKKISKFFNQVGLGLENNSFIS